MRQALFTFLSCGFDAASTGAENRVMGTSVEDQRKSLAHVYDIVTYTYEGGIVFSHESKQDC